MTRADAVRAAAEAEDEAAIRELLADLPEADRADLIPVAREVVIAQVKKGIDAAGHLAPTLLIAYGVLSASEIRKLGWRSNHLPRGVEDVLRRRSTERLVPIVEFLLDDVDAHAWRVVRPLVREGIVPRPDRPSYTIAMLAATRRSAAAQMIAGDPGLLEVEVWRLFEVEGGGEDSLANHEKFFGDTWGELFRDLAARDPAVRVRLLDVSLAALSRDFATYRAGWFSRFHESLRPTDVERAQRAAAYVGLLRSRVGPTVSMAVGALARIQRGDRLPPDLLLDRIGPVLMDASAGTAKAGLSLVARAGTASPAHARLTATVATDALANASTDVQRAALVLIDRLVPGPDERVARAIAGRLRDVAASQRASAADLLTRLGGEPADGVAVPSAAAAGSSAPRDASPIDPERAVEPLMTIEALVQVAVSVLESGEPADDLERVLAAVGRLTADRSPSFTRSSAAIARRARTIIARRESRPFGGFDPRADIAGVLLAWATGELVEPVSVRSSIDPGAGAFLSARAHEVAEAASAGRAFVSVAAPTHVGGWIEPRALVERLGAGPPASTLDLVAAILRLAPVGRDDGVADAKDVPGEAGAAVRYALGAAEPVGPTAAWWVAAARIRSPGKDDEAVERRHPGLGPEAGRAARVRLTVDDRRRFIGGYRLETEPLMPPDASVGLPSVRLLRGPTSYSWSGHSDPAMLRWLATIQPGYRETWSAVGALKIARNVDWWSAEWANRAFLEPFIDPVTAIGPQARMLLGIALGAKETGERGLASDVVRLSMADGRMTPSDLAEGLAAAAAIACDRPNRWALALAEVASSSDRLQAAVAEVVGRVLPALVDRPAAKLVPLLRLLDESLAATGTAPLAQARAALDTFAATGGQAGRLARSILSRV